MLSQHSPGILAWLALQSHTFGEYLLSNDRSGLRRYVLASATRRLERILQGDVGRVIGGLKQMATKSHLRGVREKRLSEVVGYLERNRAHMHYDEYLDKGYPIGSGVAEGACRHLVKDRLELTGMRWRTNGAQFMLDLRSVFLNNQWDKFQSFRIEQATQRLYLFSTCLLRNISAISGGPRADCELLGQRCMSFIDTN